MAYDRMKQEKDGDGTTAGAASLFGGIFGGLGKKKKGGEKGILKFAFKF
jgi:hypothetical protein